MLILFLVRDDLSWFPFYLILAKLFSNSFLASLNGHQRFRTPTGETGQAFQVVDISSSARTGITFQTAPRNRGVVIEMSEVTTTDGRSSKEFEAGNNKVHAK
ncbi:hypothetical protein B0H17DRAFT_1215053 [Mycena rosella]|uniref:Uncharacterized protein n=1 Tax=Mycena rosella TaxID=1033263 RepID=A0AAD7G3Q7_MYCRO|nr:hypothetical protein B0H17DRAFT_1215053 [Mycena rosella]